MSKQRVSYSCSNCSYQTIRWIGCCPECKEWDSFVENKIQEKALSKLHTTGQNAILTQLIDVQSTEKDRLKTNISEWDRVIGGGLMPGSLIVLTGDPGIGKSTLLLQVCDQLAKKYRVFYFSTEESLQQIKQRAVRLDALNHNVWFSDTAELEKILTTVEQQKPDVLIIDSIQNCYITQASTQPGSISQLRESTFALMRLSKTHGITTIVTGHITKEGIIAGPKTLEHMVDAVFYLQGENQWETRILRSVKNRFGTINELGFFQMEQEGLKEVPNINEHIMQDYSHTPGSVLVSTTESSRPLLLELQALTISSKLMMPQRVISGVDHKQVILLAAILEKHLKVKLSTHDIFFKVSGGFKTKSSETDLGIALSLLSSYFQQPVPFKALAIGEITVTGHIKPIKRINSLIKDGHKFGIKQLLIARNQNIQQSSVPVIEFGHVIELLALFHD